METLARIVTFIVFHGRGIRRVLGLLLLSAAVIMILAGAGLAELQSADSVLVYWGTVFFLLFLTLIVAYLDLRAIRRDFRIQKKALFVATFSDEEFRRKIREKHPELFPEER